MTYESGNIRVAKDYEIASLDSFWFSCWGVRGDSCLVEVVYRFKFLLVIIFVVGLVRPRILARMKLNLLKKILSLSACL